MAIEKRKYVRIPLSASIHLADNTRASESDLVDASMCGISVERVPKALTKDIKQVFTGIISKQDKTAKVKLVPKWYKQEPGTNYYTIGFEVVIPNTSWSSFLASFSEIIKNDLHGEDGWGRESWKDQQ